MSATRDKKVIDPTETQHLEHQSLRDKQLCSEASKLGFAAGTSYELQMQDNQEDKDDCVDTVFTHSIIHRPCKKLIPNQHFEVVGSIVGAGKSTVYSILGTLKKANTADTENTFEFKDRTPGNPDGNQERVVKMIDMSRSSQADVQCEYELTQRAPHIGMKPPGMFKFENSFFSCPVMNLLPGKDLFDVIDQDLAEVEVLTTDQRIDLCIALLEALDQQVHRENIVHRDIKLENIKVFFSKDKIIVNIFDFDLSKLSHEPDDNLSRPIGSYEYMSPEMVLQKGTTSKSDIHSMSLVLSLVFRANMREECNPYNAFKMTTIINEHPFGYLFYKIYDLPDEHKHKIKTMIQGMYDVNPETRWTIDEALNELNEIKAERVLQKNTPCTFK